MGGHGLPHGNVCHRRAFRGLRSACRPSSPLPWLTRAPSRISCPSLSHELWMKLCHLQKTSDPGEQRGWGGGATRGACAKGGCGVGSWASHLSSVASLAVGPQTSPSSALCLEASPGFACLSGCSSPGVTSCHLSLWGGAGVSRAALMDKYRASSAAFPFTCTDQEPDSGQIKPIVDSCCGAFCSG